MFQITIYIGALPAIMLFKDEEAATQAFGFITDRSAPTGVIITDSFGHRLALPAGHYFPAMIEDLNQSKLGHIELGLHQGRVNADLQIAARSDPKLQASQATLARGPSVLTPMGGAPLRMNG